MINKKFEIDSQNYEMCIWALSYLKKLSFDLAPNTNHSPHPYQDVIAILWSIKNDGERELILRKMKAAWSQKKLREKGDRKACSYLISLQTQQELAELAASKGMPINKTLEAIIKKAYQSLGKKKSLTTTAEASMDLKQIQELMETLSTPFNRSCGPGPGIKILSNKEEPSGDITS